MKITVLGSGMVGSAIAKDLAADTTFDVVATDISPEALEKLQDQAPVTCLQANLREKGRVSALVADSDVVVSAVPGFMGFEILREVVEAGKDVVDISFFEEDPFELEDLARAKGVTAVVDCGVAPGLCSIIAGYVFDVLDRTDRYVCYVGGLPQVRKWPFEYKAVFSPSDVLELYTRPARLVENGKQVIRPALSEIELLDFHHVGTLEAFNTDGLRTMVETLAIPFMKEKTLRYPGHANLVRTLRECGFFSSETIKVDGQSVRPLSMTSSLLFDQWRLEEGEADLTVMQVVLEGEKDGKHVCYTYDLLDRYDEVTRTTSMARTTGYTCAIVVRQIVKGLFTQKGICPPEFVGHAPGCFEDLQAEYRTRDIHLAETIIATDRE